MTNTEMAKSYLNQAGYRLEQVRQAVADGRWAISVRQAQECVEQALKAALRLVGVEPPRWHDVGKVLSVNQTKFPGWFQAEVQILCTISQDMREDRELSFYGDEQLGKTPDELFDEEYARQACRDAEVVYALCLRLLTEAEEAS